MKMTETPSAFSRAMILSSRSVSDAVRLEVGSSMMTRRALSDSALAISTSCICASDSEATGVSGAKSPRRAASAAARPSGSIRRSSISRNGPPFSGSRPMKMFAAAVRFSNRFSSWCTKAMPPRIEPPTVSRGISTPSSSIVPALGATTPPRIFISVDLPAPFSPTRPITSPWLTEKLMSSTALMPGYTFEIPVIFRNGSGIGRTMLVGSSGLQDAPNRPAGR